MQPFMKMQQHSIDADELHQTSGIHPKKLHKMIMANELKENSNQGIKLRLTVKE